MKPKISVLTFCCNDENKMENFIKNVSFADEIIFIDNNSIDNTVAIANHFGATVIQQTDINITQQKNLAISNAQNNWILLVDLDASLSAELKDEILLKITSPKTNGLYIIEQNIFFCVKKIKNGEFYNKKNMLLLDKEKPFYLNDSESTKAGISIVKTSKLKNKIDYHILKSFDEYNHELSLLSKEKALIMYRNKVKPSYYHFLMKPFFHFINQYFIKLGFLDGKEGFILAYINSFAVIKSYLMLWLLYNSME